MKIHILAGLLLLGSAGNALAQDVGGNVVKYHATIDDVKYVYGVAEPVTRLKTRRHPRHQHAGLLWQCDQEAGRHAQHGQVTIR